MEHPRLTSRRGGVGARPRRGTRLAVTIAAAAAALAFAGCAA